MTFYFTTRFKPAILSRFSRWIGTPLELKAKLATGSEMVIVLPDTLSTVVLYDGDFEPEVTALMKQVINSGDTFFDIGAHFGLRTLQARDLGAGKIIAFEPGTEQLKILIRNSKQLGGQVSIVDKAVSDSSGKEMTLQMFDTRYVGSSTLGNPRLPKEHLAAAQKKAKSIKVDTVSLDDYVSGSGLVPQVLKIDVENHELPVLEGAEKTLRKHHPAVIFEVNDSISDCLKLLSKLDYKFYKWNGKKVVKYSPGDNEENILAM